ncbi:GNAT family N-acetyltransferase [Elusimicrobiota bacterium]
MAEKKSFEIQKASSAFISDIARLHHECLPDDFCAILGLDFLEEVFYPAMFKDPKTSGVCAVAEGKAIGFVLFSSNHSFLTRLVSDNPAYMSAKGLRRVYSPAFLRYVIEVLILLFIRKTRKEEKGAELGYIAVDSAYQGCGVGQAIVAQGLKDLSDMGFDQCWVKTLSSTPGTTRFYERLGYAKYDEFLGRAYFVKSLK